jgi:hypothetical protein
MDQQTSTKKNAWSNHIEAQRQSGLTQNAYCRQHGLKSNQFCCWKKKLASVPANVGSKHSQEPSQSSFVPIKVNSATPEKGLTLHLPGGIHLTGITEENAQAVRLLIGCLR